MKRSGLLESASRRSSSPEKEATTAYWLLCTICLWSETVYADDDGLEWHPRVVLEQGLIHHRGCGGLVKVFGCRERSANQRPLLVSTRGHYGAPG